MSDKDYTVRVRVTHTYLASVSVTAATQADAEAQIERMELDDIYECHDETEEWKTDVIDTVSDGPSTKCPECKGTGEIVECELPYEVGPCQGCEGTGEKV